MGPIYLDNAATSFPKPPAVAAAVDAGDVEHLKVNYLEDVAKGLWDLCW